MPQFFLNKRLIILLVSIIVLVALIGFSLRERSKLTWPEQFIKDTSGWVQSLVSKPTHFVTGFFENLQDLQNTYGENKELKSRVENLVNLEAQVQELTKDNEELRDILGEKRTLRDFKPLPATVIGRNPDRWHEMIIIDKGKLNGIEKKYGCRHGNRPDWKSKKCHSIQFNCAAIKCNGSKKPDFSSGTGEKRCVWICTGI
jgi:rod shape-determining protein MreC